MQETKVLAAFIESRKEYSQAVEYVKDLSPMGRAVLKAIKDYYDTDEKASHVDAEILQSMLERQFGDVPKHKREMVDYMTELKAVDVSAVNVGNEILAGEQHRLGVELADVLLRKETARIPDKLKAFNEIMAKTAVAAETDDEERFVGVHLDEFKDMYANENLIKVAPKALNDKLRNGLIRGMHLVLAAMPEAGKSLFALNMTSGFIQQGLRVLYVGNEDPIAELVLRLLSNLSGEEGDALFEKSDVVMERARERGYDLVTFQGMSPGSIEALDAMLEQGDYDVLVIDQLRNLQLKAENNTTRLEAVAQGARNLARKHNVLVVSVTQAAESARDKLVLNSGDIDGSNIGIPGACDVIVMVGMNDEYYLKDLRKLTLVKNKRGGVHDNFTVAIDRWKSRVRNL